MKGNEWTDKVCVTLQTCIEDFEFFLIFYQQGLLEPVDGVLGLARNKPFFLDKEGKVKRGPSYMMALKNANLISLNAFSFSLSPYGEQSYVDFGVPQEERMKDPRWVQYIDLKDDFFWSAMCQGFAIGKRKNSWQWGSIKDQYDTVSKGEVYSIFDSGASAIIFPKDYFKRFLIELYKHMHDADEFELASGYVMTKCYDNFPTLHFMFGGKWVKILADEYVVDISENKDRSICVLLLSEGEQSFFIMGLPIYMNYYTIHDEENSRIGFVPNINSNKRMLKEDKQPQRVF